jgi:hypothetical protein
LSGRTAILETSRICGYAIRATEGVIGKVHDFHFDDENWVVR